MIEAKRDLKRYIFVVVFLFFLYEINSIVILLFGVHVLPVLLLGIVLFHTGLRSLFKRREFGFKILKLLRLYVFMGLTACVSGILFYLSHGILRWVYGGLGFVCLFLIVKSRHADFREDRHRQGLSFVYFFALLSMALILLVSEFHYSLDVKRIGRMSFQDGTKTALALTFDDVGLEKTDPKTLEKTAAYLSARGIPATFFVAAQGLEEDVWTEKVKSLLDSGMEIGFHGYEHKYFEFGRTFYSFNSPSYEAQKKIFNKSLSLFHKKVGIKPAGFRAPVWRENRFTQQLLEEFGFGYNSGKKTLLTSQVPFYRKSSGQFSNVVNIPSSGEFTWFYGPKWFRSYQYFINRQLVRILMKKHAKTFVPFVLVFHLERLEDDFADRLFKEIIEWIVRDDTMEAMSLNSLVKSLEKEGGLEE